MITYTSKKKSFIITDLFTSIYAWQQRIYICKSSVRSPPPPSPEISPICNPAKTIMVHSLYIHVLTISMCSFPSDLIMVVQVVNSSSSCLVRSSTPTMVCLNTLPTTHTLFRSAPPPPSSTTTWSGSDLLVGSLVWSSLKDSYWMCSSQGPSINHYSASEYMHKYSVVDVCSFFWFQT